MNLACSIYDRSYIPSYCLEYVHTTSLNIYLFLGTWKKRNAGGDIHRIWTVDIQAIDHAQYQADPGILQRDQCVHGSYETII